jgi:hypothetical protein
MAASGGPIQWVRLILSSVNKKEKKIKLGNLLSFWGQVWKERNGRVFEDKELSILRVAAPLWDQIVALSLARDQGV